MSYKDNLKKPRWQKRRLEVLNMARWRCEDCGRGDEELQVHHCYYVFGRMPWEYDSASLMCLCATCHKWRQTREDAFRVALGEITRFLKPQDLEAEVWAILGALRLRQTQRLAEAFS